MTPATYPKVLVVEDNPNDQELLRHQLRKTSFVDSILFLDDPRKALDLLRAGEVGNGLVALLLDVHLPHMSGIDFLRILRSMNGFQEVPVMIMSTDANAEVLRACQELKVASFIEKPVTFDRFSKFIASLFHSPQQAEP